MALNGMNGDDYFAEMKRVNNKGNSILNKIFGLPAQEEIDAQKELMDYQQTLAEKAWEYNSPKNQMQRLREAGLNPDLAIGGSPQNTVEPSSNNTPQIHGGSSSVPAMINSVVNAALAGSQIKKNEADANQANANTDKTKTEQTFLSDTYGLRRDILAEELGLKQDNRKLFIEQMNMFASYSEQALATVSYLRQLATTEGFRSVTEMYKSRSAASEASIMHYRARVFPQFQDLQMNEMLSKINLNDATRENIKQETRFLISSFSRRLELLDSQIKLNTRQGNMFYRQGKMYESMREYYNTYDRFLGLQIEYYPFQIFGHFMNDPNYIQTDKDGSIKRNDKGEPLMRHGYQETKIVLDVIDEGVSTVMHGAQAYGAIAFPLSFRGGGAAAPQKGFNVETPKPSGFSRSVGSSVDKEFSDLWNRYQAAKPGSKEKQELYWKVVKYRK